MSNKNVFFLWAMFRLCYVYNVEGKDRKLFNKGRKERHLSDSCLQTAAERKVCRKNRQKTEVFSQHCDFRHL